MFKPVLRSWRLLANRQKATLVLFGLAGTVSNGLDVLGVAILGILGAVAFGVAGESTSIAGLYLPSSPGQLMAVVAAVFLAKAAASIALAWVVERYLAKLQVLAAAQVSQDIFGSGLAKVGALSQPEIEWAILRSSTVAFRGLFSASLTLLNGFTLSMLLIVLLFLTDWRLALSTTVYFSGVLAAFHLLTKKALRVKGNEFASASVGVHQAIANLVRAFREITVANKLALFKQSLIEKRRIVAEAGAVNSILGQLPRVVLELALIVGVAGFFGVQALVSEANADMSTLSIFLAGSLRMISALLPLQRSFMVLRFDGEQAKACQEMLEGRGEGGISNSARALSGALDERPPRHENTSAKRNGGIDVQIQHLTFSYGSPSASGSTLSDVSVDVPAGAFIALIGPSGAGKSTLVDLVLGLYQPSTGSVLCDGMDPIELRESQPGSMAYLPQTPGLISGTILQNIALDHEVSGVAEESVWEALAKANLADDVLRLPEGLYTNLGKQSDRLSGGQRQRLGLARALFTRPRLLVLDEATSALDAESEDAIAQSLRELRGITTVITIAHRLSTIRGADNVIVVNQGKIDDQGTFDDLRARNELVSRHSDLLGIG